MELKYKHLLLFVDDEKAILNSLRRMFEEINNYEIYTAGSGQEALDLLSSMEKVFSLIISDQRMPAMSGAEFLAKSREITPNAMRVLLTGYSDIDALAAAVNQGQIHSYLQKPWVDNELFKHVSVLLQQYELILESRRLLSSTKMENRELKRLNSRLKQIVDERNSEVIIQNLRLDDFSKRLADSFYTGVQGFAGIMEINNSSLAGHGRRVSFLAHDTARLLGLSDEEVRQIEIAGLLHDIGKLGYPAHILQYERNAWTIKDWALYQSHPQEGQGAVRFLERLGDIGSLVRAHHEQFNGEGYPDGLAEDDIPLGAKIIAVANAYDNIINKRIYTPKKIKDKIKTSRSTESDLSPEEILKIAAILHIKKETGSLYDPDVADHFLKLVNTKTSSYGKERQVSIHDLSEGMVLSKPIFIPSGEMLLANHAILEEDNIAMLKEFHSKDPIKETIFIRSD